MFKPYALSLLVYNRITRSIFQDTILKRLAKNSSFLFSGNVIVGIIGFISISLIARTLGAEQLGVLALIQAYILIIDKLVNFQSWQALIKYGSDLLENKNHKDFKSLIKFGFLVDGSTAIIGTIIAISATPLVSLIFNWDKDIVLMAILYSITILFNINGTPIAILRLFNNFKLIAIHSVIAAILMLSSVIIAIFAGGGLWIFIISLTISNVIGYIILIALSIWELQKQNYKDIHKTSISTISQTCPHIWSFMWTTNLNGSIKMSLKELDIIVIGSLLGATAAGFYKIAKQFSQVINKLLDPLGQSVYPELSKLWSQKRINSFEKLIIKSNLIAGLLATICWLFFIILGDYLFIWTVGKEFLEAQMITIVYMFAIVLSTYTITFSSAMLAMGKPLLSFKISIITTLVYYMLLFILTKYYGLIGAGIAYVLYYVIWGPVMGYFILKLSRHLQITGTSR